MMYCKFNLIVYYSLYKFAQFCKEMHFLTVERSELDRKYARSKCREVAPLHMNRCWYLRAECDHMFILCCFITSVGYSLLPVPGRHLLFPWHSEYQMIAGLGLGSDWTLRCHVLLKCFVCHVCLFVFRAGPSDVHWVLFPWQTKKKKKRKEKEKRVMPY